MIRFFYVRAEPPEHALREFAKREHKPHKKAPLGFPVACVAYHVDADNNVSFAFSTHNPIDYYSRDAAKAWALYYLTIKDKNRGSIEYHSVGLIVKTRILQLLCLPDAPFRVQKAAAYWLATHTKPTREELHERSRPKPLKPFKVDAKFPKLKLDLDAPSLAMGDDEPPKKRPHLITKKRGSTGRKPQ